MTTTYLLRQRFRYEYPEPIAHLRHRLMVVPPAQHGGQRRLAYGLAVRGTEVRVAESGDGFGNHRYEARSARVEQSIEFETWVAVEASGSSALPVPAAELREPCWRNPSALTRPDGALADAAARLQTGRLPPVELAERIAAWVHGAMRYEAGATDVHTTAAEAFSRRAGVCQDYAHVMIAVARRSGLAARYVSGHLLGEGGTHAWVEVLVADGSSPGRASALGVDPTHGTRVGPGYVTVAVGRDYHDVAPTAGTFRAACSGRLSCTKSLQVTTGARPRASS